jgi:S-DNA-T family DNA segregation ATPase FtsK/SpoIIIE
MAPTDAQFKVIAGVTLKLAQLGLEVTFVEPITTGPLVTTYRFVPRAAAKVVQIERAAQDIALTLGVEDVLIRRLPGEAVIGVSVPNENPTRVMWRDHLSRPDAGYLLPLNLGVDSQGREFRDDLTKCPHLLIAGSTGGGKSVLLNSLLASLMFWRTRHEFQFALSDTKQVDFPHLHYTPNEYMWAPPANTMYSTWELMDRLIEEMERRLDLLKRAGKQNIAQFNVQFTGAQSLPYIVLVIDELADILGGDKRGEAKIAKAKLGRIVQKARAAGVHVIAAVQRPSIDVVAGTIKANFPARVTFKLTNDADSRTVLSAPGAEHLLSQGDMLYIGPLAPAAKRLHSAWAPVEDIEMCLQLAQGAHSS